MFHDGKQGCGVVKIDAGAHTLASNGGEVDEWSRAVRQRSSDAIAQSLLDQLRQVAASLAGEFGRLSQEPLLELNHRLHVETVPISQLFVKISAASHWPRSRPRVRSVQSWSDQGSEARRSFGDFAGIVRPFQIRAGFESQWRGGWLG